MAAVGRTGPDRNKIALEAVRLEFFVERNQLVQAHGVAQTLDNVMRDVIDSESKAAGSKAEEHPYYHPFKSVLKAKDKILNGRQTEALEDSKELLRLLSSVQATGDKA